MNDVRVLSAKVRAELAQGGHALGLLDELNVAVMQLDPQGQVIYRNTLMAGIIGPDLTHFDTKTWLTLVHRDDLVAAVSSIKAPYWKHGGDAPPARRRIRCQDGQYHWMQVAAMILRDAAGQPESLLFCLAELPALNADACMQQMDAENYTRYRALFDHGYDAMFLLHNSVVADCNDAALATYRISREQAIGENFFTLMREVHSDIDEQIIRQGLKQRGIFEAGGRVLRLDGTHFDFESRMVRMDINGEVFVLDAVRDVSAKVSAERVRQETLELLEQRNQRLHWMQEASSRLFAQPDLKALTKAAVELLVRNYRAASSYVGLLENGYTRELARSGSAHTYQRDVLFPRSACWDRVAREPNRILVVENVATGLADAPRIRADMMERGVSTLILVLLCDGDTELGSVAIEYSEPTVFSGEDLSDLEVFSRTLVLALSRAKHLEAIAYQADHDSLTGLHNRGVLHREFPEWVDQRGTAVLFLLDLDRFKEINDTLGHHVGDDLLRQLAVRLKQRLALLPALLCRLGGDEFAILLRSEGDPATHALAFGRELLTALQRPFLVSDVQLEIGASIGVALYPYHGSDSHELMRSADVAMYQAKSQRQGVTLYDPEFDMHSPERLRLIADLGNSVRGSELLLYYQPKLDLRRGVVVGCEALVRWQHPRRGLLLPDHFIGLAEMSDVIHELTAHVIETACRQWLHWREQGLNLSVAVNLSARNLVDQRVVDHIEQIIGRYAVQPGALELELTETTLMQDPARAAVLLERIAALGVRLSVDDFGTGYSSLAYLRRLPIHTLKIDQAFISEMHDKPQDAVIVQSIITLGHNLGLEVVAEGVENRAALDTLIALGCDQAQGYYLSPPLPAAQLPGWLAAFSAAAISAATFSTPTFSSPIVSSPTFSSSNKAAK